MAEDDNIWNLVLIPSEILQIVPKEILVLLVLYPLENTFPHPPTHIHMDAHPRLCIELHLGQILILVAEGNKEAPLSTPTENLWCIYVESRKMV